MTCLRYGWFFYLVSDIAIFVLKGDVKFQLTNWFFHHQLPIDLLLHVEKLKMVCF